MAQKKSIEAGVQGGKFLTIGRLWEASRALRKGETVTRENFREVSPGFSVSNKLTRPIVLHPGDRLHFFLNNKRPGKNDAEWTCAIRTHEKDADAEIAAQKA